MAVRYASAIAGIQRYALVNTSAALRTTLTLEGFAVYESYAAGTDPIQLRTSVLPDPVFADRNNLRLNRNYTGGGYYWSGFKTHIYQLDPSNATSGSTNPTEIIFGFTFTSGLKASSFTADLAQNILVTLWDATKVANSVSMAAATPGHILCWLCANQYGPDGVTPKWRFFQAQQNPTVPTLDTDTDTLPYALDGVQNHLEFRLNKTDKRCRIWLNGVLCKDFNLPAGVTAEQVTRGYGIMLARPSTPTTSSDVVFGNFYMLEVDAIHTGPLGPGARVAEFVPAADTEAQYRRDAARFPLGNYQVAAQFYDATTRGMLTAMDAGTHDTYSGLGGIAGQAAEIYGVISKFNAINLAGGLHTMAARVTYKGASYTAGDLTLQTNAARTMGADISRDPSTNAKWEVADLANASAGFQLTS